MANMLYLNVQSSVCIQDYWTFFCDRQENNSRMNNRCFLKLSLEIA